MPYDTIALANNQVIAGLSQANFTIPLHTPNYANKQVIAIYYRRSTTTPFLAITHCGTLVHVITSKLTKLQISK